MLKPEKSVLPGGSGVHAKLGTHEILAQTEKLPAPFRCSGMVPPSKVVLPGNLLQPETERM